MRITSSTTTQDRLADGQVPAFGRRGQWGVTSGLAPPGSPDLRYTPPREDATMRTDLVPGSRLPDLELPDHRGRPVRLSALANGYPLVVSFYRGYWSPNSSVPLSPL